MPLQLGVVQRRIIQYHHCVDNFKLDLNNPTFVQIKGLGHLSSQGATAVDVDWIASCTCEYHLAA